MSIEAQLAELTAAVKDLAAAMRSSAGAPAAPAKPAAPTQTSAAASTAKGNPAPTQPTAPTAAAQETKAPASGAVLDFNKDVGPKFIQLIRERGEAAGRSLINEYDSTKTRLSEAVKPERYPEVLARIEQLLAGV